METKLTGVYHHKPQLCDAIDLCSYPQIPRESSDDRYNCYQGEVMSDNPFMKNSCVQHCEKIPSTTENMTNVSNLTETLNKIFNLPPDTLKKIGSIEVDINITFRINPRRE